MTAYNGGNLIYQVSQVGSYSQPFNVDVVKTEYEDPYISNTVLYLKGDTLLDSSIFAHSFSVIGNPTPTTIDGRTGIYFGGDGDRIDIPFHDDLYFGSGDFTVETWVRTTGSTGSTTNNEQNIFGNFINNSFMFHIAYELSYVAIWNQYSWIGAVNSVATPQWYHVAFSRSAGIIKIFINGIKISEGSYAHSDSGSAARSIGSTPNAQRHGRFYLSELRITKGIGRYTSNFIPLATFSGNNYRLLAWR